MNSILSSVTEVGVELLTIEILFSTFSIPTFPIKSKSLINSLSFPKKYFSY